MKLKPSKNVPNIGFIYQENRKKIIFMEPEEPNANQEQERKKRNSSCIIRVLN